MTKYSTKIKIVLFTLASAGLFSAAFPLLTGAAPTQAPPDGLITPTFSGLKVSDGSKEYLNINDKGVMANPQVSNLAEPDCKNQGGLFTDNTCFFPITINDFGGLRVRGDNPLIPPGEYADVKINGEGIDINSRNHKGLNVLASNPLLLDWATLNVNYDGLASWVQDVSLDYVTYKGIVMDTIDNLTLSSNHVANAPDPTDPPEYWQRGAWIDLDASDSTLSLGARKISLGNYAANSWNGAPVYTEKASLDNTVSPPTLTIPSGSLKIDADLDLTGKITADSFGTIRTYTATSASIANGATGTVYRGCDSGVLIGCGYNANNNWYVFDSYGTFSPMIIPHTRCRAAARNSTGAAGTFQVQAICLDSES